ncbi:hypothetical protein ASF09_19270 [Sphingomonas sp. Leaf242]|nr:hypothetical protein ASF09_19270 [Sphingomonas sp. Leaf242]
MNTAMMLAVAFNCILIFVCGFAFLRGGRPERIGALINISASGITTILRILDINFYKPTDILIFSVDVSVTVAFFMLAVRTTRFWPVWALGFALSDLVVSIAASLIPRVQLFAYHTGLGIYAYLALGALALGTYRISNDADPVNRNGSRLQWRKRVLHDP